LNRDPVKVSRQVRWARLLSALMLVALLGAAGCGRGKGRSREVMYVSATQASLRDRVAAVYSRTGEVKNGDRVELLDRERRFVKVRTAAGAEGWIEQRYLVSQQIYDGFQRLALAHQSDTVQAPGITRNETNLHIEPGRDSEHLYQLPQGTKISVLERGTAERPNVAAPASLALRKDNKPAAPILEDWWLARDTQGRVGWLLARMVDVDVPLDIAQYAEGQRFVAFFTLDQVKDGDKQVPQYLAVITEPKDGLAYDFDQARVFTWNVKKHRYETAYREHGLNGVLPVTVTHEGFDKEGDLPVFILRVKDDAGNVVERKYKLNTPIVRRVLAPGEVPSRPAPRKKRRR
jgi:SH3-like domain-containing protein